jgi:hypothetical protein
MCCDALMYFSDALACKFKRRRKEKRRRRRIKWGNLTKGKYQNFRKICD